MVARVQQSHQRRRPEHVRAAVDAPAAEGIEPRLRERHPNAPVDRSGDLRSVLEQELERAVPRDAALELVRLGAVARTVVDKVPDADRAVPHGIVVKLRAKALEPRDEIRASAAQRRRLRR